MIWSQFKACKKAENSDQIIDEYEEMVRYLVTDFTPQLKNFMNWEKDIPSNQV